MWKCGVIGYLLLMNLLTLLLMCVDKWLARRHRRRIPERTLLGAALLGGCFGGLLGMYLARHKTRHVRFAVGLPLMSLVYAVLLYLAWLWLGG